jgi:hypothetical protein
MSSICRLKMAGLEVLFTVITPESVDDVIRHINRYVYAYHSTCEELRVAWTVEITQHTDRAHVLECLTAWPTVDRSGQRTN